MDHHEQLQQLLQLLSLHDLLLAVLVIFVVLGCHDVLEDVLDCGEVQVNVLVELPV